MKKATKDAIRARFETKVARSECVPVVFGNAPRAWLNGQMVDQPKSSTWLRLTIAPGETRQTSFGDVTAQDERTAGVMIVQINVPVGQGERELDKMADAVAEQFRRVTVGNVAYRTPTKGQPRRRGQWWALAVRCPFSAYESTAPSED